jgi:hypothetical protein
LANCARGAPNPIGIVFRRPPRLDRARLRRDSAKSPQVNERAHDRQSEILQRS